MTYKYGMNIFDGTTGVFVGYMEAETLAQCERLISIELKALNAVELFDNYINKPVSGYNGMIVNTDADGFCYLKE